MTTPAQIRAALARELLEDLTADLCAFDLCDGPDAEPIDMKTCRVCSTIHTLRRIVEHATHPVCECEHVHHFDDQQPHPDAHPYMDHVPGARAATVAFMHGANFCDWCLTYCHPTAARMEGTP